jgi:RHS repeat-associated protein
LIIASNHLGNVLAVVTDNINMDEDRTTATVASASDYYPFGLQMDGRTFSSADYRYGFNGKEKDDSGEFGSTVYDYGFRIHNPAIAKFLSVDPLTASYPWYTPYQFAGNKPIMAIDLDGAEEKIVIMDGSKVRAKLKASDYKAIVWGKIKRHYWTIHSGAEKNWSSGYDRYTLGMGGKDKGWYGPGKGTLSINSSGGNTYDPSDAGIGYPQTASFREAFGMAADGFDELLINPTDHYSRQFQQSVVNYFGIYTTAFSFRLGASFALGKGAMDALNQTIVHGGDVGEVDWINVSASILIKNNHFRNAVAAAGDFITNDQFNDEKTLQAIGVEFLIRGVADKGFGDLTKKPIGSNASYWYGEWGKDLVKRFSRDEVREIIEEVTGSYETGTPEN